MQHRLTPKIQDIIAIGKAGEHKKTLLGAKPPVKEDPLPRLIAHIKRLIDETVLSHNNKLRKRMQKGKSDPILTRLVLNEFSLYVKDSPLTLDQYKEIIAAIAFFSKKLPPNIHLIFSSFPVLWPNEVLHNVGIHVQSPLKEGDAPHLHHFDKRRPSGIDRRYFDYEKGEFYPLYGQTYAEPDYYETELSPNEVLADTAISINDVNQYRGTIKAILAPATEGELEISMLIINVLCIEHDLGIGTYNTTQLIKQLQSASEFVPTKATHVISSYTIEADKKNLLGDLTQADPHHPPVGIKRITPLSETGFGKNWTLFTCRSREVGELNQFNLSRHNQESSSISTNEPLPSKSLVTLAGTPVIICNDYKNSETASPHNKNKP